MIRRAQALDKLAAALTKMAVARLKASGASLTVRPMAGMVGRSRRDQSLIAGARFRLSVARGADETQC